MRTVALTLAFACLPSLAAAQQWPTVSGQITVQTAPPPPPPQQMVVQAPPQQQPVYVQAPPPPPPQQAYAPVPMMQPQLNYNMVYGPEPATTGARVQLVVGQAVNGMALGLTLAGLADARSSAIYSGAMLLGGGVGAVGALLASRDGVTAGQAAAVNYGSVFGGLASMFTAFGLSNSRLGDRAVFGIVAGGLAVGTGAGIAWAAQTPLGGRVEFASSMGIWSAFLGAHLYLATRGYGTWDGRGDNEVTVLGWSSLGFMAAGLTAGVLLAPQVPVSAARMRWINLSAAGGYAVIGLSSLLLAADGTGEDALMAYSIGSMVGVTGGALLGYFLTTNTDSYWERMHEGAASRRGPTLAFSPGSTGAPLGGTFVGTF